MKFETIGLTEIPENKEIVKRQAVRGIVHRCGQYLLVTSDRDDYGFPGGGIQEGESHEEAVRREVEEETGYVVTAVRGYFGYVIERRTDLYEEDKIFEMYSHYYFCDVASQPSEQHLDAYEARDHLKPVWLEPEEAMKRNLQLLNSKEGQISSWLERTLYVLKTLVDDKVGMDDGY